MLPVAAGVPIVDTAWLSQLLGFAAFSLLGVPGVQMLYGALVAACAALMLVMVYRPTRSVWWALTGCGLFLWVESQQLAIVRPQLVGLVCYLCLLAVLTPRRSLGMGWKQWIGVPALFVLWVNCHGSFVMGLVVLASFCAGRAAEVLWQTRRVTAVVADLEVRAILLLTALASAAALINPYGLEIYYEVATFSRNPNLDDLVEWQQLTLRMRQGQAAGVICLWLLLSVCLPPRRIPVAETLLLTGLGITMLWASRMIVWWGPVAAYAAARRGHAICERLIGTRADRAPLSRSPAWTFITVGICLAALGIPLWAGFVPAGKSDNSNGLSPQTPVAAVTYLNEADCSGRLFNKFEWGDYLLWAEPPGLQVFVASHVHLIPVDVWDDYMRIAAGRSGWREALDAHHLDYVLIDPRGHSRLSRGLRKDQDWSVAYTDDRATIFVRANKKPRTEDPGGAVLPE